MNNKDYTFFDLIDHVVIESNNDDFYKHKFPFKLKNSEGSTSNNFPISRTNEPYKELDLELKRRKRV